MRVEIQTTETEVDGVSEPGFIAEAPSTHFHHLDPAVDTFCAATVSLANDGVEDILQMRLDRLGRLLDQFYAGSDRPGKPRIQSLRAHVRLIWLHESIAISLIIHAPAAFKALSRRALKCFHWSRLMLLGLRSRAYLLHTKSMRPCARSA